MADSEKKWNRFQRLGIKSGAFSERAKRAEAASMRHAHKFIIDRIHSAREVRRHIAFWLLGMGALIGIATAQFFLYQSSYITSAGGEGGTYAEAVQGDITTLNPLYAATDGERAAAKLMFSSLLTYDKTGKLQGDLAQNYSVLDEGKRYRITLKPTIFWHDNKRLTSEDIIFTVGLLKNPATGIPGGSSWNKIEAKRIDERTVDFILPASYAPFPHALVFPVVPKHILTNVSPASLRDARFASQPIGSGPFSFRLLQHVQTKETHTVVHMNRSTNFYGGTPKVEKFQLHGYASSDELVRALRSHAVNAVSGLSLAKYRQLTQEKDYDATIKPINAGVFALFNTKGISAVNDIKVRQALQVGTDVSEAISTLPVKLPALDTPLLESQVSLSGIDKPSLDRQKAAALLDEAGWKRNSKGERFKDKEPLLIKIVAIKDADYENVVANLAKQWRSLGVRVETRMVDTSDPSQNIANSVLQPRDFDVLVHELNLGADPDVYAYWHSSQAVQTGLNFSGYTNGVSDDTLASARSRVEDDLREAKYKVFVRQWLKDAPAIGLYQSQFTYVHTKSSSAFDKDSQFVSSNNRFGDVLYWTTRQVPVYKTP